MHHAIAGEVVATHVIALACITIVTTLLGSILTFHLSLCTARGRRIP